MSLIGPRPLLVQYLSLYSEDKREDIKSVPVSPVGHRLMGRNAISWQQKFEYDVWYVENVTFLLDFKIVIKTIKNVLIREGINSDTSVTMEAFKGNLN